MSLQTVLEICAVVYAAATLIELFLRRKWPRFVLEIVALLIVVAVALLLNNSTTGRVAFGQGTSPIRTVALMFIATICGIGARYIFYLQSDQFSLLNFLKPIFISPIVLLPLIGSVQTSGELNGMQVVSFAVLAFQNGFFWQAVLTGAKPVSQSSSKVDRAKRTR